jgi:2-(1,2-epoxy-1,2-dihydrophenyl)acetyl-CoA isomerase
MSASILLQVEAGVATITLNRPQVLNALDAAMLVALRETCEAAARDDRARAIVLRGAGPAFLAGGDVAFFHAELGRAPALVLDLAGELNRAVLALRGASKPVVAAVHGAVAGAGVSLALAADMIFAAEDTQFTLAYSRIGASPDGGTTWFLPRLVGYQRALEWMLLSEPVDAVTLSGMGVVNRVFPVGEFEDGVRRIVTRLAAGPTRAYAQTKALANRGFAQELEAHLEEEARGFAHCAATGDFAEGVRAFVEKRQSQFKGQ